MYVTQQTASITTTKHMGSNSTPDKVAFDLVCKITIPGLSD